ncbi:MAG: ankyrin repeat domain-containing protein [Ignavibacteriales bacterium]|nr:ankyrin repeat domain-containing protein [Ignavibacteriales bacterium]
MKTLSAAAIFIFAGCFSSGSTDNKFLRNVHDGNTVIVKTLIERKRVPNINIADSTVSTALMIASARGHIEIVKILLQHGASTVSTNIYGKNAIDLAKEAHHLQVVEILNQADRKARRTQ